MSAHVPIPGHAGFYRRGGRVHFRFRDRRRRLRWDSAQTVREAERKKLQRELEVERGDYQDGSRDRFADYARSWIDTYAGRTARGISETTRDDYRQRLEQDAIPHFGRMRLSEIEPRDVKEYASKLEKPDVSRGRPEGLAPNTVRLCVAPVRALLATAVEEGVLRSNPAAGLRLAQTRPQPDGDEGDERVKAMSEDELRALLAAVRSRTERWALFFDVLAWSGLRIGEAIELRWRDVDLGERIVHVRRRFYDGRIGPPKSRYGKRRLRLTPELARALWRLRAETKAGDDDLIFTARGGSRIHPSNLMRRVLKPAAVEAGLAWVGFHSFRHTCATILFRKGWNAVQVQRWLGHHKPSFTLDTYVHLLDEDVPEPTFFDAITATCDTDVTQTGRDERDPAEAAVGGKA